VKNFDHVLIIGFGGPTKNEEILPFLRQVAKGRNIPETRLKEVGHHYERVGGSSPYNGCVFQLAARLKDALQNQGQPRPVFVGMRNWHPFLHETLAEIKKLGLKQGIGVILAPHRCEASYERYIQDVDDARRTVGAGGRVGEEEILYQYLKPWHDHPLFIQAQADEARKILGGFSPDARSETYVLFSAHSIPLDMPGCAGYQEEILESCKLVAAGLGVADWSLAYQSRSGGRLDRPPRPNGPGLGDPAASGRLIRPWLEPDVTLVIKSLAGKGKKRVLVIPIGFLCDNVEVLYDLDVEAREEAEKCGLQYFRAKTVTDHPKFVAMLQSLLSEFCPVPNPS